MQEINPPLMPTSSPSELRKIIVTATSEMLDNPDERGIYPTSKFYDRLENEINEYMQMHPTPTNIYELLMATVRNAQYLTVPMQALIAKYLDVQSVPPKLISGKRIPVNVQDALKRAKEI